MKDKTILIVGPYGFVGSELVKQLQLHNDIIINHKNFDLSESKIPKEFGDKNLHDIDTIFFCADTSTNEWIKNPGKSFDKQMKMQSNLIEFWKQTRAQFICFTSHTAWPENDEELFESNITNGALIPSWEYYGYCKRTLLTQLKADKEHNKWTMLGLPTLFGHNDKSDKFIPTLMKNLEKNTINCVGDKDDFRSFAFVEDIIQNIIYLVDSTKDINQKVINIGGFHNMKVIDVANVICKIANVNPQIHFNHKNTVYWNSSKRFLNDDLYQKLATNKVQTLFEDAIRKMLNK